MRLTIFRSETVTMQWPNVYVMSQFKNVLVKQANNQKEAL